MADGTEESYPNPPLKWLARLSLDINMYRNTWWKSDLKRNIKFSNKINVNVIKLGSKAGNFLFGKSEGER